MHPVHRPNPVLRFNVPEILFLLVKVGRDVVTHECKKAGDGEGFITVSKDFIVYSMFVVYVGKEGDDGVNGYHNEYANYADVFS